MDVFVSSLMDHFGAFGIALLMFLENVFPPIPSELIMPLAGYEAASGRMSLFSVIVAGTVGSLLGTIPWYYLGKAIGERRLMRIAARYGRWMTLSQDDVRAADLWFRRYGIAAVLFGRLVPTVRTLISVPAGLAHMSIWVFLAFSAIGSAAWTALLAVAGYLLGQQYEAVSGYVGPVSNVIIVAIAVIYVYRVVTFKPSVTNTEASPELGRTRKGKTSDGQR